MTQQPISQDQANLEKVVLAGMKILYDKKIFPHFMAGFKSPGPLPTMLAAQAAGLVKILDDQSKGAIPKKIIVPAGVMLMVEMADFLVKAKLIKAPSKDDIAKAITQLTQILLKVYSQGSTPAQSTKPAPGAPGQQPAAPAPAAPQGILQGAMQ